MLITVTVVSTQLYSHPLPKVDVLLVTHTDREKGRRERVRERKRIKYDNWTCRDARRCSIGCFESI